MTTEELVLAALRCDPEFIHTHDRIGQHMSLIARACEAIHASGGADAFSGDVDSPTGYFYRVSRWVVVVNTQGFIDVHGFDTEDEASKDFGVRDDAYSAWDNDFVEL